MTGATTPEALEALVNELLATGNARLDYAEDSDRFGPIAAAKVERSLGNNLLLRAKSALEGLGAENARLRPDAERWRRAVRSCLADPDANGDPVAAVECVSHLALHDAEAEIARLREALEYCVCQTECLHGLAHITSKARAALRGGEDA